MNKNIEEDINKGIRATAPRCFGWELGHPVFISDCINLGKCVYLYLDRSGRRSYNALPTQVTLFQKH